MMQNKEIPFFKILFIIAAFWNLAGAIPGYFDTANTFNLFFGRELDDPLFFAIYKGSWGTTLLYFFGYLIVAYNPASQWGIVIVGTIGKVFFAAKLLDLYLSGLANPIVLIVITGDFIFTLLFLYYLIKLFLLKKRIVSPS
jgi:hypothetical protein